MANRREIDDRRATFASMVKGCACNRRNRPDRRLNSISAVWIPMEQIKLHPATRLAFNRP